MPNNILQEICGCMGFKVRLPLFDSDLDKPLLHWSPKDALTVRGACQNIAIFGKTGSGKTSGSGDYLLPRWCGTAIQVA